LELDRFGNRESNQTYFVITSQAMRSSELPAGSRDIVIGGHVPNDDASSQDHSPAKPIATGKGNWVAEFVWRGERVNFEGE